MSSGVLAFPHLMLAFFLSVVAEARLLKDRSKELTALQLCLARTSASSHTIFGSEKADRDLQYRTR